MKEFYRKWRYLIGIVLVIIGGVLGALTGLIPFIIIAFVGVFLFASFSEEQVFFDYVIAGSTKALVRKRYYYNFIPFTLISMRLTLGKGTLLIPRAEEYFIVDIKENEDNTNTKITRKEYKVLLQEQRKIYSTQRLDKEFMRWAYTPEGIGLKRKKARLIAASIFAALSVLFILTVKKAFSRKGKGF